MSDRKPTSVPILVTLALAVLLYFLVPEVCRAREATRYVHVKNKLRVAFGPPNDPRDRPNVQEPNE